MPNWNSTRLNNGRLVLGEKNVSRLTGKGVTAILKPIPRTTYPLAGFCQRSEIETRPCRRPLAETGKTA